MTLVTLETDRCRLRAASTGDAENFSSLVSDAKVRQYLGGPLSTEEAETRFHKLLADREGSYWIIEKKSEGEFVGLISLDPHHDGADTEVSFQILPKFSGRGIATEVVTAVLDYAFAELKLPKVVAETQAANAASRRLLEKVGMTEERTLKRFGESQTIYTCMSQAYRRYGQYADSLE